VTSIGRSPSRWWRRRGWRAAAWSAIGVGSAAGVVTVTPATFGLSTVPVVLHLVSFRSLVGLGFLGGAAAGALTLLFPRTGRPWLRLTATGALLALGVAQGAVQVSRGWGGSPVAGHPDLVVVSFNTLHSSTDPELIADLVAAEQADMVSLPETLPRTAQATAQALATRGLDYQVFSGRDSPGSAGTTSMLVRDTMGPYRQVAAPFLELGAVRAIPESGDGPVLVAVHPAAPVPDIGYGNWDRYVTSAADQCRDTENAVVAGDFNATVDHRPLQGLGRCADAAGAAGRGAEGTWPASLPSFLASPIDHVLYDTGHWRVLSTQTHRVGGSDHRALVARFARA
jgi:endonuclease/exonuclease/phosphatase (EEP) superfamily protein YafD